MPTGSRSIEGNTARGDRVLVGLRGPVLGGLAVVADLLLSSLRLHFLDLGGLALGDLVLQHQQRQRAPASRAHHHPGGALPDPPLAGAFRHDSHTLNQPPALTVQSPAPLLWIRDGVAGAGHNKPEGLNLESPTAI